MTEPLAPPESPPTVEVVSIEVAEQLMSDLYRRIADLESQLEAVEREAAEAEQDAGSFGDDPALVAVAAHLLECAADLREQGNVRSVATGDIEHG